MADSRSKRRGESVPLPPTPPEGGPDDLDYVYRTPGELQSIEPYYAFPLMSPEMRRYRMGGRQMTDPRNFEFMQRKREEARTQGTRLKKGGPVKKYNEGGAVEIEIKVGGGGKGKGMHKMPDGSMMEDSEHESEEYRKGGKVKKYQKGGAVEDGKDKYPSERSSLKKELVRTRQRRADMDTEVDPTGDREAVMSAPFRVQRPPAFYPLTGRDYVGPRQQMEQERARREAEVQRRGDVARRSLDDRMSAMESSLSEMGTKENKQNYRKGGMVKPKAPAKKMAKGGATSKNFIQKAIKKPGALRAQLGAKPGQNIPAKKLAAAAKAPGKLGQRARFAQTLAKMKKGK